MEQGQSENKTSIKSWVNITVIAVAILEVLLIVSLAVILLQFHKSNKSNTPGTQTPGTHTPGTQTPGTQTPGTHTPGTIKRWSRCENGTTCRTTLSPTQPQGYQLGTCSPKCIPKPQPPTSSFKKVIYIGYWLVDESIPDLVKKWKSAGITHVLLTFILFDAKTGLKGDTSMLTAWSALSPQNQQLLLGSFVVGISIGGANGWPSPISQVYTQGIYKNNPEKFVEDLLALVQQYSPKIRYFDFDLEQLETNIDVPSFCTFFGTVNKLLKTRVTDCVISHAPQTPYFTPQWQNVYMELYKGYGNSIDFFNIQYYNNGPSDTFAQIFQNSDETGQPGVAVAQLIQRGLPARVIVVGKPVNAKEGAQGFVPLVPDLSNIVLQAKKDTSELGDWGQTGGMMIWYYNTQQTSPDNQSVLDFFQKV